MVGSFLLIRQRVPKESEWKKISWQKKGGWESWREEPDDWWQRNAASAFIRFDIASGLAAGPILKCLHLSHLFSFQTKDAWQSEWVICKVPEFLSHPCIYILGWGEGKWRAAATFWKQWGCDTTETCLAQEKHTGSHSPHRAKLN